MKADETPLTPEEIIAGQKTTIAVQVQKLSDADDAIKKLETELAHVTDERDKLRKVVALHKPVPAEKVPVSKPERKYGFFA